MPFYPVTTKGVEGRRVVEADNPAAALRHVATSHFTVAEALKAGDLVTFMQGGGTVEKAGDKPAETTKTEDDK